MKLPNKWSEVSLKKYIQIVEVSAVDMNELDKHVKILSILSGESEDKILDLSLTEVKGFIRDISFIYTKPEGGTLKKCRKLGGNKFDINYNLKNITGGEYIDLTSYVKDPLKTTSNLPEIIAIFLKPVNLLGFPKRKCYKNEIQTSESREATAKLIYDHMMMDEVAGLSGFFLRNYEASMKAIQGCLTKQTKKNQEAVRKLYRKKVF